MIQSILISRQVYPDPYQAAEWIKAHNFIVKKLDVTSNYWRFRQKEPTKGAQYRIKTIADGIEAVFMWTK